MNKITITVGNVSLPAELNDSPTAQPSWPAPRAYSPVNPVGRVISDATRLRAVKDGTQARLTREDQP